MRFVQPTSRPRTKKRTHNAAVTPAVTNTKRLYKETGKRRSEGGKAEDEEATKGGEAGETHPGYVDAIVEKPCREMGVLPRKANDLASYRRVSPTTDVIRDEDATHQDGCDEELFYERGGKGASGEGEVDEWKD